MVRAKPPLPIYLPIAEYEQLEAWAREEERDVLQQARWIIRCALAAHASQTLTLPVLPLIEAEPDATIDDVT